MLIFFKRDSGKRNRKNKVLELGAFWLIPLWLEQNEQRGNYVKGDQQSSAYMCVCVRYR